MPQKNKPNEIYITRVYDAPVKLVWDAWTDPNKAAKWWGPRGFTITTHSKDLRAGGHWHYTMHGPDKVDYPNKTKYFEVIPEKLLVYDHGANDEQPALFRVRVEFSESKGKTTMEMTMTLETAEAATQIKQFIKQASGNSTWDRLAEYLSDTDRFVINRSFDANIDLVFDVWTRPEHIAKWLAPTGFTMKYHQSEILEGSTSFYSMSGPNNITMYGKAHYREIKRPTRLVYTQIFCDENGNVSRHPMAPTWPETMLTTICFAEEGPNSTRVTITWEVFGEATELERKTFHDAKSGMNMGWTGSFDKLEDYLNQVSKT